MEIYIQQQKLSRLFTALYALGGTAIVVAALGVMGTHFLEKKVNRKKYKK